MTAKITGPGGVGIELAAGKGLSAVLAAVAPGRWLKGELKKSLAADIVAKYKSGEPLDDADLEYVDEIARAPEAKLIRQKQIFARAARAIDQRSIPLLGPMQNQAADASPSGNAAPTPDEDWKSRYWEDASLVSDDLLQEIYGRILASEVVKPGSCSLRTLKALRYMDRTTAGSFGRLLTWVFSDMFLPRFSQDPVPPGLSYDLLLDLNDAGLIDSSVFLSISTEANEYFLTYGALVLQLSGATGISFAQYPLTSAGRELARISQVDRSQDRFFWTALRMWREYSQTKNMKVSWAEMPNVGWQGNANQLDWHPVSNETIKDPPQRPRCLRLGGPKDRLYRRALGA